MRRKSGVLWCLLLSVSSAAATASAPLDEEQLLELARDGVETGLIVRLVERDCVSFELDARTVLRLSESLPAEVLHAALDCLEARVAPVASASASSESAGETAVEPVAEARSGSESPPMPQPAPIDEPGDGHEAATGVVGSDSAAETLAKPPRDGAQAAGVPLALEDVGSLFLVPATMGGRTDDALAGAIRQTLEERGTRLRVADVGEVAGHYDDDHSLNSGAPLEAVLRAARAAGVDAVLLTSAHSSMQMGNRRIRFQSRLVETRVGEVLWRGGGDSERPGLSWDEARGVVAGQAIARLP